MLGMRIPKYLYHRTNEKALLKIIQDKKILCTGTPASNRRFEKAKFDVNGNDKWKCIFLARTIRISAEMTWGGNVVLKIQTDNLDKSKFQKDSNYNGSFKYKSNIPTSEICKIIKSDHKKILDKCHKTGIWKCTPKYDE